MESSFVWIRALKATCTAFVASIAGPGEDGIFGPFSLINAILISYLLLQVPLNFSLLRFNFSLSGSKLRDLILFRARESARCSSWHK